MKNNGIKVKVYLLIFSCMWSRAINLKICTDLTVGNFLRAFQMHCFDYRFLERCISYL